MNLIEQAAKRLAELQRAGVDTSAAPGTGADRASASSVTRMPAPEALAGELDAARSAALRSGLATPASPRPVGPAPSFTPSRKVQIDLLRL